MYNFDEEYSFSEVLDNELELENEADSILYDEEENLKQYSRIKVID